MFKSKIHKAVAARVNSIIENAENKYNEDVIEIERLAKEKKDEALDNAISSVFKILK